MVWRFATSDLWMFMYVFLKFYQERRKDNNIPSSGFRNRKWHVLLSGNHITYLCSSDTKAYSEWIQVIEHYVPQDLSSSPNRNRSREATPYCSHRVATTRHLLPLYQFHPTRSFRETHRNHPVLYLCCIEGGVCFFETKSRETFSNTYPYSLG